MFHRWVRQVYLIQQVASWLLIGFLPNWEARGRDGRTTDAESGRRRPNWSLRLELVVHCFRMTTYVLGAGASVHAGYPLCLDLWSRLAAWAATEHAEPDYLDAVETVDRLNGPIVDVERIFTDLDLGQGAFRHLKNDQRQRLEGRVRRCLRAFLLSIRLQNLPAPLYAKLATTVDKGDAFVTFNYDVALENALIRAQRFRVRDGYGPSLEADWDEPRSDVTVLKLHGSINWIGSLFGGASGGHTGSFHDSLGQRPFVDNMDWAFPDYPRDVLDRSFPRGGILEGWTTLVLPTYEKKFMVETSIGPEWTQFYGSLWSQAAGLLARSERIVMIGYSMPAADRDARAMILSNRNRRAEVFLCCASSNRSLGASFGEHGLSRVRQSGGFEDWLAQ